jgi:hypothetical protein
MIHTKEHIPSLSVHFCHAFLVFKKDFLLILCYNILIYHRVTFFDLIKITNFELEQKKK